VHHIQELALVHIRNFKESRWASVLIALLTAAVAATVAVAVAVIAVGAVVVGAAARNSWALTRVVSSSLAQ
jgi:hypothetical protein